MKSRLKIAFLMGAVVLSMAVALQNASADDPALVPQVMVIEGESVPGVGWITEIHNVAINNNGDYLVEVDTSNSNTDIDEVILKNGTMLLQEGQSLPLPAGATLNVFDAVTLNNNGDSGWNFHLNLPSTLVDSGLYFNTDLLIQEGDTATAADFSPGTVYDEFETCKFNDSDEILFMATVNDPGIPSTIDRALVKLDSHTLVETVIIKEGDPAPGTTETVLDFDYEFYDFDFNNNGDAMFVAELTSSGAPDAAIYLNDTILARNGEPAPVAGRTWSSVTTNLKMDLNNNGGYVFHARMDGSYDSDYIIVKNGEKFVQEGDTLPSFAPWKLTSFGTYGYAPVLISDYGDVLWYGNWDDPDTSKDDGIFLNEKLILQEGVTVIDGYVVDSINFQFAAMSDDGRYILVPVRLGTFYYAAILYDRGPWDILGGELAGSNGTPMMRCYGQLAGDDPLTTDLHYAKKNSFAHLILGYAAVNKWFKGTTLVPRPDVLLRNLPTDSNGNLSFTTTFPPGSPAGFEFWGQFFITDSAAPFGFSASNAVKGTTP